MSILHLIASGNYIVVNRSFIKLMGLDAAVLLGELASEYLYFEGQDMLKDSEWFYSTVENLEANTGLSTYEQRQAINKLVSLGIIEVKKMGIPAKRWVRICEQQVIQILNNKSFKNCTTGDAKIAPQVVEKLHRNKNREIKIENNNNKRKSKKERIDEMTYDQVLDNIEIIRDNPKLRETCVEYIKMRKRIKAPLTSYALYLNMNEAYKIAAGDISMMQAVIEQSIKESYRGIFPLKDKTPIKRNNKQDPGENPYYKMLEEGDY